ncbi:cupin domain-containing protein [Pantoea sp. 1.19]|uniref:cupin domain-containing protein n=1 Tax=Pantoea sp. 1.19 TaxID=1925589 RepID=UPI000948F7F1|nr:cupin domain-containing protein [Pantoea sp. 1.19]
MIKGFYSEIANAGHDSSVGIRIAPLVPGRQLSSFGTRLEAGKRVGCHAHAHGDEWYIVLAGEGRIWLADVGPDGQLTNKRSHDLQAGDTFPIAEHTAHQLVATTQLDFIFLCPPSHLQDDRTLFADLA